MPDDTDHLIRRLIGGDEAAPVEILDRARSSRSPILLVAAALLADHPAEFLARAVRNATTTRDRLLVAIAEAHLDDDPELADAFVREHLADHPDSLLAAWIAARHTRER